MLSGFDRQIFFHTAEVARSKKPDKTTSRDLAETWDPPSLLFKIVRNYEKYLKTSKNRIIWPGCYFFFPAAFLAGFLAVFFAVFFAAAISIHLLPERVINLINLSINKYFGRNGVLQHRIGINLGFDP